MGSPTVFSVEEANNAIAAEASNAYQADPSAANLAAFAAVLTQIQQQYAASNAAADANQAAVIYAQQTGTPYVEPSSVIALASSPAPAVVTYNPAVAPAPAGGSTPAPASSATAPVGTALKSQDELFGGPLSYCDLFPDDPLCQLLGEGTGGTGGTVIVGGNTTTVNVSTTVQEGLSGTDVAGIVDDALDGLWKGVVGAVDAVIADAVGAIQKVLTDLGNALKAAYAILSRLAGFILNALKVLVDDVVKGILAVLQDIRNLLADLYKDVLLPIAKAIPNIRQALLDVYKRFIRPMLIVLQDIRKVLAILAAFHVGFAQKLDAKLADLEARITRPLFYLLSFVNGVANWVNLIVTAGYLLQKDLFLASLKAYVGEALNLQINAMNPPPSTAAIAAAGAAINVPSNQQTNADFTQYLQSGTGAFVPPIADATTVFQQYLTGDY